MEILEINDENNDENNDEDEISSTLEEDENNDVKYACDDLHLKIYNFIDFTKFKMENIIFYSMIFGFLTVIPILKKL